MLRSHHAAAPRGPSRSCVRRVPLWGFTALLVLAAACSAGPAASPSATPPGTDSYAGWASAPGSTAIVPIEASSQLARGPERFLFTLVDSRNRLLAAPDVAIHLRLYDLAASRSAAVAETDATFFWAIEGQRGLYRANVTFTRAGRWGIELTARRTGSAGSASGGDPLASPQTVRFTSDVLEAASSPAIGAPAPASITPTLADAGGDPARISTDPHPDPRFYRLSVKAALATKEPFLLIFATPAFCKTAICGPTLEVVKRVVADFPSLTVVHVEPYQLAERDGALQPVVDAQGQFQPVAAVNEWGLASEPYTFLVAADGTVVARFEGPLDPQELRDAIRVLVGA